MNRVPTSKSMHQINQMDIQDYPETHASNVFGLEDEVRRIIDGRSTSTVTNVPIFTLEGRETPESEFRAGYIRTHVEAVDGLKEAYSKQPWFNLTPLNGTTAHSEYSIPQYCRVGDIVYLRGAFRNVHGSGTMCAILPEGYRPVGQDQSVVQNTSVFGNSTYFARWVVRTNGEIEMWRINRPEGYQPENWFPIHTSFVVG